MHPGQLDPQRPQDASLLRLLTADEQGVYLAYERRACHEARALVPAPQGGATPATDVGSGSSFGGGPSDGVHHPLLELDFSDVSLEGLPAAGLLRVELAGRGLSGAHPVQVSFSSEVPENPPVAGSAQPTKPMFPPYAVEAVRTWEAECPSREQLAYLFPSRPSWELEPILDAVHARLDVLQGGGGHCLRPAWTGPARERASALEIDDPVLLLRVEDDPRLRTSFGTNTLYVAVSRAALRGGRLEEAVAFHANA